MEGRIWNMEGPPKTQVNEIPFRNLVDSDILERFSEIENNPNKVIRKESFDELNERYNNKIEIIELTKVAKRLFDELAGKYNILVAADFLIGKNKEGGKVVYSIVDKIDGGNLEEVELSTETATKAEVLYASVAKYFFDKSHEGGLYLCDINNPSQYVYGRKNGEQEDKIYLIDTDIYISNSRAGMYLVVNWLTRHMSGVEKHFKIKFEKAREYIRQFVEQPLPEEITDFEKDSANKNISEIKKFLNNEKFGANPNSAIPTFE